jgi:SAM-dependent methyltransferase
MIVCPNCHYNLEFKDGQDTCPNCRASYTYHHGIYDFIPEDDFYWGEISRQKMRQINRELETDDWVSVVLRLVPDKFGYITDPGRLSWLFHCYDQDANQVCLDIGSGWGSLAFGLHQFYETVYSQDGVLERLQFQALRAASEGVKNIRFLRSDLQKIPLPDNSVDLVVINGVLEWVGLRDSPRKPEEIQHTFMLEVRRVLKSGGIVYLGIENRFGAQYFLGYQDHSGLPFTSLLPRSIASLALRIFNKYKPTHDTGMHVFSTPESSYRTYTYSKWGPLDGRSVRHVLDNLGNRYQDPLIRLFINLILLFPDLILSPLIQLFSPYFIIFASVEPLQSTIQSSVLRRAPDLKSFVRFSLGSNTSLKSTYLLLDRDGVTKVVNTQANSLPSKDENRFSFQESEGINGRLLRSHKKAEVIAASKWLAEFQNTTTTGIWSTQSLSQEISTIIKNTQSIPQCTNLLDHLVQFEKKYLEQVSNIKLPIVTEHGDYTPPNILVGPDHKLHLIDWEHSRERGNPMLDVGAFSLSLLRFSSDNGRFPEPINSRHPFFWFFQNYDNPFAIPVSLTPTYYLLRLIHRITRSNQKSPAASFVLFNWCALLPPALEFSINVEESGY